MTDKLILVDADDRQIGTCSKMDAHYNHLLHRAFSVFIFRRHAGRYEILLQKRAVGKYHSGGLWTNACCSHPRDGELLEAAVKRRLMEEVGIETDVRELFSFIYFYRFDEKIAEYEYDHVFLGEYTGELAPDPEEIEALRWITPEALSASMLKEPDAYTPWFIIAAPRVISCIRGMISAEET